MARYRKQDRIDAGGFGCVFKALCLDNNEIVAFKELSGRVFSVEERKRFAREVKIQTSLSHPNIVPILGSNLSAEPPWFVMPLAVKTLRKEIDEGGFRGNSQKAVEAFFQILNGIGYAHDNGVIHRDLKPENILVFEGEFLDDCYKIADFGLGKLAYVDSSSVTRSHMRGGTIAYMPPEQCVDLKRVDLRGDIYSLGKIFYEMLTQEYPLHVNLSHADLPRRFSYIVDKCTQHDPDARYQSAKDIEQDLSIIVSKKKVAEPPRNKLNELILELEAGFEDEKKTLDEIDKILLANSDDEVVYTQYFIKLGRKGIAAYFLSKPRSLIRHINIFDSFLSEGLPFAYTDDIADFYSRIWKTVDNQDVRRIILRRLLGMGYDHNRWHVAAVFGRLVKSIDSDEVALIVRDILRGYPAAAAWAKGYCDGMLHPIIAAEFLLM
jgi:serine/threonine protein kinase